MRKRRLQYTVDVVSMSVSTRGIEVYCRFDCCSFHLATLHTSFQILKPNVITKNLNYFAWKKATQSVNSKNRGRSREGLKSPLINPFSSPSSTVTKVFHVYGKSQTIVDISFFYFPTKSIPYWIPLQLYTPVETPNVENLGSSLHPLFHLVPNFQ